MDNREVKIVDEHNLNRDGKVIVAFNYKNESYCMYSIVRNENSDNLFISKLESNGLDSYNLVNIESDDEKKELSQVVRDVVVYTVNNDSLDGKNTLVVNNETVILLPFPKFNEVQAIIIEKTYVNTVGKAVTKVAFEFFNVKEKIEVELPKFDDIFSDDNKVLEDNENSDAVVNDGAPSIDENITVASESVAETVNIIPEQEVQTVEIPDIITLEEPVVTTESSIKEETVPPIVTYPEINTTNADNVELNNQVLPVVNETVLNSDTNDSNINDILNQNASLDASNESKNDVNVSIFSEPVDVEQNDSSVTVQEPTTTNSEVKTMPFFDISQESNLNKALGEVSNDSSFKISDLESVREFGVEESTNTSQVIQPMIAPEQGQDEVKTLVKSKGFANNKFIMALIVMFFVSSCVFMGYEVFNYLNLK